MSFCKYKSHVEVGDTVVVYVNPRLMYSLKIKEKEVFQTRFGALRHDDIVGKPYGSKLACSKGYVHIMDMTPELWTITLPHRTQIIYGTDISFILIQLQLKPGSIVIEAGTGSGSLSHSIARTIAPNGRLFTFDFHKERADAAREEFTDHGLGQIIIVQHRDVCADGFINIDQSVDAVFLDLPHPWEAIESASSALKNGGRICCFSPCIEQVQKSSESLRNLNFMDVETYECVLRPYEFRDWSLKKFKYDPSRVNSSVSHVDQNNPDVGGDTNKSDDEIYQGNNDTNKRCKLDPKLETEHSLDNNDDHKNDDQDVNYFISYMNNEVAGHTGFLTFATKFDFTAV